VPTFQEELWSTLLRRLVLSRAEWCGVMRGGVRIVWGYASLIPRSRNMRNQTKARFSQELNKKKKNQIQTIPDSNKIRFKQENHKQITKVRFKQITKKKD
jgi:hypothetical protein